MKKTLQFLIDNICADFTVDSLLGVVKTHLAKGTSTLGDMTYAIMRKGPSLDVKCAEGMAEGAVQALSHSSDVEIKGSLLYAIDSDISPK